MTISEIKNLSSEDVMNLNRDELIPILKQTSGYAKRLITNMKKYLEQNPDTPKPLIFQDGSKEKRDWRTYKFPIDTNLSTEKLKMLLEERIELINRKTIYITGWRNTLEDFKNRVIKQAQENIRTQKINELKSVHGNMIMSDYELGIGDIAKLTEKKYDVFWRVYNELQSHWSSEISNAGYGNSPQFQTYLYEEMSYLDDLSFENLLDTMMKKLKLKYEESESQKDDSLLERERKLNISRSGI